MIIECEKCRTQFRLEDPRIYGRSLKVKCSKCDNTFIVESVKPGATDEAEPPLAPPPPEDKTGEDGAGGGEKEPDRYPGDPPSEEQSLSGTLPTSPSPEVEWEQEREPENPAPEDEPITGAAEGSAPPERGGHTQETGEEREGSETPAADYEPGGFSTPVTTGTFLFSREEKREPQEDTSLEEEQGGEETVEPRDDDTNTGAMEETPVKESPEEELPLPLPEKPGIKERERLEEDAPPPSEEEGGKDEIEVEEITEPPATINEAEEAGEDSGSEEEALEDNADEERSTEKEEAGEDDQRMVDDLNAEAPPVEKSEPGTRLNITYDETFGEEEGEEEVADEAEGAKEVTAEGEGDVIYDLDVWEDELRKSSKEKDFSIDLPSSGEDADNRPEETGDGGFEPGRGLTFEVNGTKGVEAAETTVDAISMEGPHHEAAEGGGASRGKVFTAIIAAIAVGVFVAWGLTSGKFAGLLSTEASHEKIMEIDGLNGFFILNKKIGKVFVVEARLKNITDKPQETGGVRGVIYHGRFSGAEYSPTISPGRVLSPAEIKDLSKSDLERRLGGTSRAVIPPKGTVPVMVVFTGISRAVSEYGIDVMK